MTTTSDDDYGDDFERFDSVFGVIANDDDFLLQLNQICGTDVHHVWTMIENDDNSWTIHAGIHVVNRVGFLKTQHPWVTGNETVIYDDGKDA